jgi:hypothetical protein
MPQLPQSFSAYPENVTLDANGEGAIAFQATGSNIRITNISVRASSATAQAIATIYKGQIGDAYRMSGTNSGSTGDSISVPIDLFDGERIFVVWTGGDVGAIATATFSGNAIPKGDVGQGVGGSSWSNPIAAGDGSLIYPALKSPNYVPNTNGWQIGRNGGAEFFSLLVRAGSMTVRNQTSGASVSITPTEVGFYPPDPINVDKIPGFIKATLVDDAATGYGQLSLQSASVDATQASQIAMRSSTNDGQNRKIILAGDVDIHTGELTNTSDDMRYMRGQRGEALISFAAAVSATPAFVFPVAFPPGVVPNVHVNINSNSGSTRYWTARAYGVTNTGFTFWFATSDAARVAEAWTNIPVQWTATID